MNWTELKVYDVDGNILGTLGELVQDGYDKLTDIALDAHGAIDQWQEHAVAKPFARPTWEVPTGVDWSGFMAALQ
jgi:hypothetical protein